jgi:hypothetical protein
MQQDDDRFSSRSEYFESLEDIPTNPSQAPTLGDVINRRFNRRDILKGALGVAAMGALAPFPLIGDARASAAGTKAGRFAGDRAWSGPDPPCRTGIQRRCPDALG